MILNYAIKDIGLMDIVMDLGKCYNIILLLCEDQVGNSFSLDCIHSELSKQLSPKNMLQFAPTGVSAIVCGGVTYQSKLGLCTCCNDTIILLNECK